jgi:hypothetical protein
MRPRHQRQVARRQRRAAQHRSSDHLNLIGGTGIALTLAGLTIVAATT